MDNPSPQLVNGALWSLFYETSAYLVLLILFLIGIMRSLTLCTLLLVAVLADPFLSHSFLFPDLIRNPQFTYLPGCFALGTYLTLVKQKIVLGSEVVARHDRPVPIDENHSAGSVAILCRVVYIAALRLGSSLGSPPQDQGGRFVWHLFVGIRHPTNDRFKIRGASLVAGYFSWILIEKPIIAASQRYTNQRRAERATRKLDPVPHGQIVL